MKDKYIALICLIIATLGSLYSMVMLIFYYATDLFSFNFWNSVIAMTGWYFFMGMLTDKIINKAQSHANVNNGN